VAEPPYSQINGPDNLPNPGRLFTGQTGLRSVIFQERTFANEALEETGVSRITQKLLPAREIIGLLSLQCGHSIYFLCSHHHVRWI
jgi:hypothetical protein